MPTFFWMYMFSAPLNRKTQYIWASTSLEILTDTFSDFLIMEQSFFLKKLPVCMFTLLALEQYTHSIYIYIQCLKVYTAKVVAQ
jgi:hypothetical protein